VGASPTGAANTHGLSKCAILNHYLAVSKNDTRLRQLLGNINRKWYWSIKDTISSAIQWS